MKTYSVMCAAPIPGAAPGPGSHQKFSHVHAAAHCAIALRSHWEAEGGGGAENPTRAAVSVQERLTALRSHCEAGRGAGAGRDWCAVALFSAQSNTGKRGPKVI